MFSKISVCIYFFSVLREYLRTRTDRYPILSLPLEINVFFSSILLTHSGISLHGQLFYFFEFPRVSFSGYFRLVCCGTIPLCFLFRK